MVRKYYDLMTACFTLFPKQPGFLGPPGHLTSISSASHTFTCLRSQEWDTWLTAKTSQSRQEVAMTYRETWDLEKQLL